ncbi:MAG: 3'-5' exonuclease [Clostridia bacterium]|nr:3'-5' exonuclease [Clostridia bacterium]MDD4387012.1 3'-5' exonuclease [Clostridia bacterium]
MKLLFLDVETGGMDEVVNSLLTIGMAVWEDGNILDSKEIYIKKEEYNVVQQALDINKINLDELRNKGIDEQEAINQIEDFCGKYFADEKIISAGHNVAFDMGFIKSLYRRNSKDYYKTFSYRFIDTGTLLRFMYMQGKFEKDISSSDKAFEYFNITFEQDKRHTALGDTEATVKLFNKLLEI